MLLDDVTREYYINDAGNQITNLALSLYARYLQALGYEKELPEDGYHGKDIIEIAKRIQEEEGDCFVNIDEKEAISYFRNIGTKHELEKIQDILKEYRVSFDVWFSEVIHI